MRIWGQMRVAGAFTMITGVLLNNMTVSLLGLVIQYVGLIGGVDGLERDFDALVKHVNGEKEEDK